MKAKKLMLALGVFVFWLSVVACSDTDDAHRIATGFTGKILTLLVLVVNTLFFFAVGCVCQWHNDQAKKSR